ncbi:MAG TPA: sulfatase-like hydrolase/transferase [Anaerolineales bacterium]|nr:sulfatase-like hydrolase/transferase [Anaerolineales bacterium]
MKTVFINSIKKYIQEFLAAFLLAATLFFFAPISVYIENAKVLHFNLEDIWYFYFFVTLLVFSILLLVILLVKRIFPQIILLFTALGFGFLLQGNFLISDLGMLDGREILWNSFGYKPYLELIIWTTIIAVFFIFRRYFYQQITSILVLLIIYQLGSTAIGILSNPVQNKGGSVYFETEKEFEFSQEKNVIFIVLDSFRAEAFEAVLQRYPEYRDTFKDFIYYQDAVGGYTTTRPSIPLALTGEYFDNSISIWQYIAEAESKIFPIILQNKGFSIENYPLVPFYSQIYDNFTNRMPLTQKKSLWMNQYLVAGIRYTPLVLKRFFVTQYYQGQDYYHKDIVDFVNRVKQTIITKRQPTFKLYHLSGAHPPFQLDAALNRGDKGYIEQAAASLEVVSELISELKETGGYDNSLIIIVGDHGSGGPWEYAGTTMAYNAQILMLAKRVGQQFEDIQYSQSRVTLGDVPKSIAEEMGFENTYPGYSIFEPIPTDRVRKYFYYYNPDWSLGFLPIIYEIDIQGPATQWSSYTISRKLVENQATDVSPFIYHYGENIFDTELTSEIYRLFFSNQFTNDQGEKGQTWVWGLGPRACLQAPVEAVKHELTLSIDAEPFLVMDQLEDQKMVVTIDQYRLATFQKNESMDVVISSQLAENITRDEKAEICFEFPDATKSPKEFGISDDPRLLGYLFNSLVLK